VLAALAELGVTADDITFLDRVDGHLDRLSSSERSRLEDDIVQILGAVQPGEIYMPYRVDVHPDHIATHDLVRSAATKSGLRVERWQYLIWSLWRPEHLDQFRAAGCPGLRRVSIRPVRKAKKRALAQYRSQFEPIGERRPAVPKRLRSFMTETDEFFVVDRSAVERAARVEHMDDRFPEKDRELL
jgi:LmbE family N-acetylglucosaminyl deacetylase